MPPASAAPELRPLLTEAASGDPFDQHVALHPPGSSSDVRPVRTARERALPQPADLYSVSDRLVVTTGHTDARLDAFEDRDAQRNLRRYRALSIGFGCVLVGGAAALASSAIGSWADVHHRSATQSELVAKFSLTVFGGVVAGGGALLSFGGGFDVPCCANVLDSRGAIRPKCAFL